MTGARRLVALLLVAGIASSARAAEDAPTGPLLDLELEATETLVGQALTLRLRVVVPTWMPSPPELPDFEAANLLVRLPERATGPTSRRVGGETWSGVVRAYRLTPMAVGRYRLPPQAVRVTWADPQTRAPITTLLRSQAVAFDAVVPEGARDLDPFLAAASVEIEQRIEGDPAGLVPGGAVTRIVTARTRGTSALFVPPLVLPLGTEGLAAYPKEPVVGDRYERGGLVGERSERVTYVAETPGRFALPALRLRWLDVETGEIAEATAPGLVLVSRGPLPGPLATLPWQRLARMLGALVLLGAIAIPLRRRLGPPVSSWLDQRRDHWRASEAFAFARLRRALERRDLPEATRALALWTARLSDPTPELRARIAAAMTPLGARRYAGGPAAPHPGAWQAAHATLQRLREQQLAARNARHTAALPPLNPPRTPAPATQTATQTGAQTATQTKARVGVG